MNDVLEQLARSGLLPSVESAEILDGKMLPKSEVVMHLLIAAMDAHMMTECDLKSSCTERRISRQNLGLTFLLAITSA